MRPDSLASATSAHVGISVILPVYNEEERLAATVAAVQAVLERDFPGYPYEIVLVDDASTDRSLEIGLAFERMSANVRYIRREYNGGPDAAIATGVAAAHGDVMVVLDADLSYKPSIIRGLVAPILTGSADIACASAYAPGGEVRNVPTARAVLSRWANRYLAFASRSRVHTFTCIVRAYSATAARELYAKQTTVHGSVFDAIIKGFTIVEIPAVLEWPATRHSRMRITATVQRIFTVLWSGIRFRCTFAARLTLPKRRIATNS